MKAFITGVNGFVGGHLCNLLKTKGFEIYGIDRSNQNINNINYSQTDITDRNAVHKLINDIKPDLIFHLAAISAVQTCTEQPELTKKINITGTENVLSACIYAKINPKILITSSAHVYGPPKYIPIDELHPINPINEYGKSKLEQEKVSLDFFHNNKLNIIISRSFNHIGPNQSTGFACSDFAKQIAQIEKGIIPNKIHVGDINTQRDFTDVRDIVKAYFLLLEKGIPGEIYNIGSAKSYSIREILKKLISLSSVKADIIEEASLVRKEEIPVLVADNRKVISVTGWSPQIDIDTSIKDILEYWRNQV